MISFLRLHFFPALLLLCACAHHQVVTQPVPQPDSAYTGLPSQPVNSSGQTPPRAALVALPPANPPPSLSNETTATSATATNLASAPSETPPPDPVAPPAATDSSAVPPDAPTNSVAAADQAPPSHPAPATDPTPPPNPVAASSAENMSAPAPAETSAPTSNADPASSATDADSTDKKQQVVVVNTSAGKIVIELDDFAAPKTCKNFRQLIQDGFYNHTVFHRVIPNFIIQGGDPLSKSAATDRNAYGQNGPGYTIPAEIDLKHDRGAVAMARLPDSVNPNRDSNGSQFYICLAAAPSLDDEYTVFGHVVQGMDVADKISEAPRDKRDNPLTRVEMTVTLESKDQNQGVSPAPVP